MLCASMANTSVRFHGRDVPVCRMHSQMWTAWGADAEANSADSWGWDSGVARE
jgi:hypothetical protein